MKKSLLPTSSLIIDKDVHRKLKIYCEQKGLKIKSFVEMLINEKIEN